MLYGGKTLTTIERAMSMKTGSKWIHKTTKEKYSILNECKVKTSAGWADAVIYMKENEFFVRTIWDFSEHFEPHDKIGLDSKSSSE